MTEENNKYETEFEALKNKINDAVVVYDAAEETLSALETEYDNLTQSAYRDNIIPSLDLELAVDKLCARLTMGWSSSAHC